MLVHQRTQHLQSLKSLLNRNFTLSPNRNELKRVDEEYIDGLIDNEHLNLSAKTNVDVSQYLESRIMQLEKKILQDTIGKPYYKKLITVPGIGKVLALTITLETGNINRFEGDGNYASYSRCVTSKRISNKKNKGSNNRKNGNEYLSWAFVEAANFMRRYCPQAEAFHMRKSLKENSVLATKALACKIAKACFYIMRDDVVFDVEKMFGKPLRLKQKNKGRGSKPERGLANKPHAPIGDTAATDLHANHNNASTEKMQDKN